MIFVSCKVWRWLRAYYGAGDVTVRQGVHVRGFPLKI